MARKEYNKIIITNLPSFYKINLFNRLADKIGILVIFTGNTFEMRNENFFSGIKSFDYINLMGKSSIVKIFEISTILAKTNYEELILGGWDEILLWISIFLSPKARNSVIVESSSFESTTSGLKGLMKRVFLSRIHKAYASGFFQRQLLEMLNFQGAVKITKGVGVFNYQDQPDYQPRDVVKNFLYVGRISEEKNLNFIVDYFNTHPDIVLHIIGYGPQEVQLRQKSKKNIIFYGSKDNSSLFRFYQEFDVFILPSIREVWGVVVEEALNNGMPVIVSDRVGCLGELVDSTNGLVFSLNDHESFDSCIKNMMDINNYNRLRKNISLMCFDKRSEEQVSQYL